MADRYLRFTGTAPGRFLTRSLGLPQPTPLRRWSAARPDLDGPVLRLTAGEDSPAREPGSYAGIVLDATGIADPAGLRAVHTTLHPLVRGLAACGRVVVLGAPPDPSDLGQAAAQQALEGIVRSLGKEIGRGRTVQL
ncbi:MAG: short chain dehydrogenase, partial [Actinomycetia bacterium]|nr:short chain dehydrogenase [Actinomycetes bacterium]